MNARNGWPGNSVKLLKNDAILVTYLLFYYLSSSFGLVDDKKFGSIASGADGYW